MTTLRRKLARNQFVITAEITPPVSGGRHDLVARAAPLAGLADALNITDAASARPAMSSIAGAAILAAEGIEPVMQMTCRDRNRIALTGDLLGAAALGITNMLILHGDDPKAGDMPGAKPVFDLDSRALMNLAHHMSAEGTTLSGRQIIDPPDFFIGCADSPRDPGKDFSTAGLSAKIAAGARFAQTQFCFDLAIAKRYFSALDQAGITADLNIIAGVGPLLSLRQARYMNQNLFGVTIPDHIMARLENATDERAEGRAICVELIHALSAIKGVAGVHIMAPMQNAAAIAATIKDTGLR